MPINNTYTMQKSRRGKKKSVKQLTGRRSTPGSMLLMTKGVGQVPTASVRLRYAARYGDTLDVGNAYTFTQEMRGNSAFDPDYTGVGAQPWGFDNYSGLYNYYRCTSSTLKATFYTRTAATTNSDIIGYVIPFRTDLTVSKGALNVMNLPFAKFVHFDNFHNGRSITVRSDSYMMYPSMEKGNNNFRAAVTASPTFGWVYTVGADGNSVAADTAVDVLIEVIYDLQFEDPIELTAS